MSYGYGTPGIPMVGGGQSGPPPVPMNVPTNLFRYGEQSLWSTLRIAPNTAIANTTNRLFTTPLGQQGQGFAVGLTIGETNLKEGGRIPAGVAYDVFGVSAHFQRGNNAGNGLFDLPVDTNASISVLVNFLNNGVLSWDFTQTQVDIAPLHMVGAGGGAFGSVSQNAAAANSGHMNSGPGSLWLYRKHPVALPGNSVFSIVLRFGGQAAAVPALIDGLANQVGLKVSLLGYYKNLIEIG